MIVSPLGLKMKKCEMGAMLIVLQKLRNDRDVVIQAHKGAAASVAIHNYYGYAKKSLATLHWQRRAQTDGESHWALWKRGLREAPSSSTCSSNTLSAACSIALSPAAQHGAHHTTTILGPLHRASL
jgi:hypothetical protein